MIWSRSGLWSRDNTWVVPTIPTIRTIGEDQVLIPHVIALLILIVILITPAAAPPHKA